MTFNPKNILVTGAAGFIGCNFVKKMLTNHDDIKITSLDKLTYAGSKSNLNSVLDNSNHQFIEGDIGNDKLITSILKDNHIDTIVHFAAESHVDNSITNPKLFLQTNILGTFTLLESARIYWQQTNGWDKNKCRFHHVSTDEVYGALTKDAPLFTENNCYQPNSPYSASKAGADHIARAYFQTHHLPITTSICSNNFGPYQHLEKLIPTIIKSCIKQRPIPIYGDGTNIRDWLYVGDHIDAIKCILNNGQVGEAYNIGGNNEIDNMTLAKMICHIMDDINPSHAPHQQLIVFVEDRKGHDWRYAVDNGKIMHELGWKPKQPFIENLVKTIKHYILLANENENSTLR
jgi:dTDP-glucose 4,6-dehydratase